MTQYFWFIRPLGVFNVNRTSFFRPNGKPSDFPTLGRTKRFNCHCPKLCFVFKEYDSNILIQIRKLFFVKPISFYAYSRNHRGRNSTSDTTAQQYTNEQ